MTLSIIVFNFYPVTAIMIVLLALLNDAPIMSIAYDNVRYSNEPEKWNMRVVSGIASFLGLIGVLYSFGIFLLPQMTVGTYLAITQKEGGYSLRKVCLFDYGFYFRWYFFMIFFGLP
jgi:magnesium-transporting ATPase (P-type)